MHYPVRSPADWAAYDCLPWRKKFSVTWRETRHRFNARHIRADRTLALKTAPRKELEAQDIPLILCVRNAEQYLPLFLRHYRGIGVTRFLIVDDRSTDRTAALLSDQPDVDLYVSKLTYAGAQRAAVWRDTLMTIYRRNRWYLIVDIDEFLVYPGYGTRPIGSLIKDLENVGLKRGMAPMLDLYPDGPLMAAKLGDVDRVENISPMIDGDGYTVRQRKYSTAIKGGTRNRLYGNEISLTKFPLMYADRRMRYVGGSIHRPLPFLRNYGPPCSVLLHLKFTANSVKEFTDFVTRGEHFEGARFYREIVESEGFSVEADLRYEKSIPWGSASNLVAQGFMKDMAKPNVP